MLTQKQEVFCTTYFETGNATQSALTAGYSPNGVEVTASKTLTIAKVQARLQQLRDKVASKKIANVQERQERLTTFLREDNYTKFGRSRQSNIQATDILNKMDKIYEAESKTINYNDIKILVVYDKERTGKLIKEGVIDATE